MTGSSAAALTGLMFVVITLITRAEQVATENRRDGIATFSTPTVMHFCAAFLISAVFTAPWRSTIHPAVVVGLVGLAGLVYILRVTYRAKRVAGYNLDLEDWTWYNVLPFVAYGAIFGGAIALERHAAEAMFAVAGGVVVLIFLGIRNAWDVVTYLTIGP
jgi:hypothetical protein